MNRVESYFRTVEERLRRSTVLSVAVLAFSAVVCVSSVAVAMWMVVRDRGQVYVLDQGKSLVALRSDGAATREMEATDHVRRFHELFFNIAPNRESIEENLEQAFKMADRSAYDYWATLSEREFYTRAVSSNMSQQMTVDSVRVNTSVYPYDVHTWAHYYQVRQSSVSLLRLESTCRIINVSRSVANPHGMMMENFVVTVNELVETRGR